MNLATILMLVVAAITLGFISATLYALRRWTGGWRWLATVPLLFVVGVALKIMLAVRADSTAHNLWPFEMLGMLAIASALLGAGYVMRLFTQRTTHRQHG